MSYDTYCKTPNGNEEVGKWDDSLRGAKATLNHCHHDDQVRTVGQHHVYLAVGLLSVQPVQLVFKLSR